MGVWRLCWPPKNDKCWFIRRIPGTAISPARLAGRAVHECRAGHIRRDRAELNACRRAPVGIRFSTMRSTKEWCMASHPLLCERRANDGPQHEKPRAGVKLSWGWGCSSGMVPRPGPATPATPAGRSSVMVWPWESVQARVPLTCWMLPGSVGDVVAGGARIRYAPTSRRQAGRVSSMVRVLVSVRSSVQVWLSVCTRRGPRGGR